MAVAPFEIIAIPDTQNYNDNPVPNIWTQQAQWIVANKTTENIVFVTGEGDVTNNATTAQWDRAINGWNLLNGVVPYSVSLGNHDHTNITTSLSYVGDSTHQGGSAYGGVSPDGQSFYQNISAGGLNLINLNLKYNPTDSGTVTWAQGILSANSGKPTIVTTHDYMNVDGTRSGVGNSVWSSLINNNSQIFMVLAGHNHGESRLLSTNANTGAGNKQVAQILADYQSLSNGGDGYLRKIQFDPTNSKISVSTYSPSLNASQTDADSQFAYLANFNATTNQVKLLGAYTAPITGTISLTGLFTENFDSITATGTTAPTNWQIGPYSTGQNNNATPGSAVTNGVLTVDNGSSSTLGQNFNYGTTGSSDRAIGTASTSTPGGDRGIQVGFTNQTGQTISKVRIQYAGEEWRAASTATGYTMWYSSAGFGTGFTSMGSPFTFTPPVTSGGQLDGNASANRQLIDAEYTLPSPIADGQALYFTWHDVNDSGLTDNGIAIDDFSITPMFSLANNLVWDAVGYSAGNWNTTSTNKPWLNGSTASAFTAGDNATFSHNNGATVAVDAGGVTAGLTTISNTAGIYTFSGGAISGPLVKSNGGTAVFQAANSFSSVALNGGIVQTQINGALGAGGITLSGGTWKTTTNNQNYGNTVTINTATSTIWTDSNLTLTTALTSGATAQTVIKDGPGVLQMSTDQTNLGVADNANSFTINNGTVLLTGGTGVNYGTGKGNLIVNSGGKLAGTGRINPSGTSNKVTVNLGGTIAPGLVGAGNAGTLYITSDLVLAGTYAVDLMSAASYDWLQVASDGAINLSGSTLNINLGYAPTDSPVFKILQNDNGTYGSVLGGYVEGATVSLGSYLGVPYQAKISYLGGDGNDIVLNNVAAALPTLVWNAAGYATGTWNTLPANKPWLDGATPSAFSTGSKVVFSQDGGAAVAVDPAGVSAEQTTISNASGTYTFSGGQITGKLVKSGTGSAEFNMPVNFSTATVSGGSTTFLSGAAGTVAIMNVSGGAATFNAGATTSVPALNVSAGAATINNTTVGAVAVSGAGQVNLGGSVSTLTVTGGTVATTGSSAQVGTADLSSPGTGTVTAAAASPLTITSTLKLADGITASISSGNSFKASSSGNLASNAVARTLTLSGGTMTVSAPAAPTSGLVGYWKLDETSGTTAADSSPGWYASWDTNGHTTPGTAVLDSGTVVGAGTNAVFTSAGKFGGAIQLSGTTAGYVKLTGHYCPIEC
jgi:hypothetical protein